jgi:hypothetical protein
MREATVVSTYCLSRAALPGQMIWLCLNAMDLYACDICCYYCLELWVALISFDGE